jgi:hypothetical protein
MKAYLAEHGILYDAHAATDDTSEVMFLDEKKWIRRDKLAPSTAKEQATTGVDGDPTKATPELGKTARFSAEVVLDILRTHPMVILEGVLQVNPFFIPPDEFLRELHQRRRRGGVS